LTLTRNSTRIDVIESLPGGAAIYQHYLDFRQDLPDLCNTLKIQPSEITYADYAQIVSVWTTNYPL
jgi:hypothetical protein